MATWSYILCISTFFEKCHFMSRTYAVKLWKRKFCWKWRHIHRMFHHYMIIPNFLSIRSAHRNDCFKKLDSVNLPKIESVSQNISWNDSLNYPLKNKTMRKCHVSFEIRKTAAEKHSTNQNMVINVFVNRFFCCHCLQ